MKAVERKKTGAILSGNTVIETENRDRAAREKTLAYRILRAHEKRKEADGKLHIGFDAMISHDITYVGIIQTARASGMKKFPIPYALTNCHNSLCAVGGTINEDDHAFGLSAAKKYGGIYVPANQAVIHQFAREKLAGCGKMILGSDSHTRYGCYGTLAVGEGGGELAKQLLDDTWDIDEPEVVLVWVTGKVPHGIGPHDVAIALVGETFPDGFAKNRILEFAGPGIGSLSMDFRTGIDVMTTETGCLSSIWPTDGTVRDFYRNVGRPQDYRTLAAEDGAYYDAFVTIDLDRMESMIALPYHPSMAVSIHDLQKDPEGFFKQIGDRYADAFGGKVKPDLSACIDEQGRVRCEQGVIVGCAGGLYDNIAEAAAILKGKSIGNGYFDLSVYPSSTPIDLALVRDGITADLLECGAVMKPCFCGPCFGAGDTPANGTLSIRHATRNFANREGSKPAAGQLASVALMDARSIAATAANGGILTAATDSPYTVPEREYCYSDAMYEKRCYFGFGKADPSAELRFGPNIRDWPEMPALRNALLVKMCAVIEDEVTTTDELIPSGETSSYRSNPEALSEFALSRRVPDYVGRSKKIRELEKKRESGETDPELKELLDRVGASAEDTTVGSCIFARKPGDGSAREQAASCQKVLGGFANICYEFATKRYRSNCINWGILPFTIDRENGTVPGEKDWVYIPGIREGLLGGKEAFEALLLSPEGERPVTLHCGNLSAAEREILAEGCLMNWYAAEKGANHER